MEIRKIGNVVRFKEQDPDSGIVNDLQEIVEAIPEHLQDEFIELFLAALLETEGDFENSVLTAIEILSIDNEEVFFDEIQVSSYTKSDGTEVKAHKRNIEGKTEAEEKPAKKKNIFKKINEKTLGVMTKSLEKEGYSQKQAKAIIGVSTAIGMPIPAPGASVATAALGFIAAKAGKKAINKVKQFKKSKSQTEIEKGEKSVAKPEGEHEKPPKVKGKLAQRLINRIFGIFNIVADQDKYDKTAKAIEQAQKEKKEFRPETRKELEMNRKKGKFNPEPVQAFNEKTGRFEDIYFDDRKHTPIVSEKQRRFFGAVVSGKAKKKTPGLSKKVAKKHLEESKGKKLPEAVKMSELRTIHFDDQYIYFEGSVGG